MSTAQLTANPAPPSASLASSKEPEGAAPQTAAQAIARAAEQMIGAPFRLHGRSCETGVDCVGLILLALHRAGFPAEEPVRYRMRNGDIMRLVESAAPDGMVAVPLPGKARGVPMQRGDIALMHCGPAQYHLAIMTAGRGSPRAGYIHAHAGLRRVVFTPGLPSYPLIRLWRSDSTARAKKARA